MSTVLPNNNMRIKLRVVLIPIFLFTLFYLGFVYMTKPVETAYSQLIGFTFKGLENHHYPNGDRFRLEDVISKSVVEAALEELGLSHKYDDLTALETRFSIFPYSPQRDVLIDKYNSILADGRVIAADIDDARQTLTKELSQAAQVAAVIRLDTSSFMMTEDDALRLINAIPKQWVEQAVSVRGVSSNGFSSLSTHVIKDSDAKSSLSSLRQLWSYYMALKGEVSVLLAQSEGAGALDVETGLSLVDVNSLMSDLEQKLIYAPIYWSRNPDNLLVIDEAMYSSRLFQLDLVKNLDYLILIDVISDRIDLVKQNVNKLISTEYGGVITDPLTGMALDDLVRLLDDMKAYDIDQLRAPLLQLGISKDSSKVPLYYRTRIKELERERESLGLRVASLQNAEDRYLHALGNQGNGESSANPMGAAFLDKIVSMSNKSTDTTYRQALSADTIQIEKQSIEVNKEIQRLEGFLALFSQAIVNKTKQGLKQEYTSQVDRVIPQLFKRLEEYASVTQRISNRLRYAADIQGVYGDSAFLLPLDAYLQDTTTTLSSASPLIPLKDELLRYSETVERIISSLNNERYGLVNTLYRQLGEPTKIEQGFLSKQQKVVLFLGNVSLSCFALFLIIAVNLKRRNVTSSSRDIATASGVSSTFSSDTLFTKPSASGLQSLHHTE
ncbi:hypothetical protein [Marinomonas mediterranea]|jgi:hypothetical protein|uniref:Uncharacterized protein n=1 Tax=Marinomonas mediterranea (strain ATCC 700492 / JCM 21426 / NBRC 103028 / MMB-1) TaxID=717774 RepID=F2K0L2_MARM1|nr:hypothetical protein [Marinomonas mediterranea]ADZ90996.1 hypothetical protein Marme_1740 [Marinomonas mediterranea MMB-1]WCN17137.1 hypothetical protein GV053_08800 [Marinomonas mediterranea MMB-1]